MKQHQLPTNLQALFDTHEGIATQQQALAAGLAPHTLAYHARKGTLERVQRGVYRLKHSNSSEHEHLLEVALRVPKGVICLMSAAAFHGLGTFVPSSLHLALPRGARQPKLSYPPVSYHHFSKAQYQHGIEKHPAGNNEIKVYSQEKTLADLLRFRHRYGLDLFLETLKEYLAQPGFDIPRLLEAARIGRVEQLMRQIVTTVLA